MFLQWRSKRHFPMDSGSSMYTSSSQPSDPFDTESTPNRSAQPMQSAPANRSAVGGVKAFGRAGIAKAAKFRPGTREGSSGTRSPMSFANGPRSNSRSAGSLEYGRGVVPDDSLSDADGSDESNSPVTPQHQKGMQGKIERGSVGRAELPNIARANPSSGLQDHSHVRLESIGTLGSFEDFRSLIAFSSPTHLIDESPSLTTSTDLSTPDFASVANTAVKNASIPIADKPQPPIPSPKDEHRFEAEQSVAASGSKAEEQSPRQSTMIQTPLRKGSRSEDQVDCRNRENRHSSAPSLPKSVSQPGSSQLEGEEFHPFGRSTSDMQTFRKLEANVSEPSHSAATLGLGIIATEGSEQAKVTRSDSIGARRSGIASGMQHKSSSETSGRSSIDSWGRFSFGRDALLMLMESEKGQEPHPASGPSSKTMKTYVSDSGHSTNTTETSADIHESDQLSVIKERTESPTSILKRNLSVDSGFSQSQKTEFSDARTSRNSASSVRSGSPESRLIPTPVRLSGTVEHRGSDADGRSLNKVAVSGLGSPTFGFSQTQRKMSQSEALGELLPPLELEAAEYRSHIRSTSNASSSTSRKAAAAFPAMTPIQHTTGSPAPPVSSQLMPGPSTAPLPSQPFPSSTSSPMLQARTAGSAALSSEPNTPNPAYEVALAKAVGKQRKGRPAALALHTASLAAYRLNGGSALSPRTPSLRGLASPARLRALPPSAPPSDPLPPIPNTPSLAPETPQRLDRSGSWATIISDSSEVNSEDADSLKTPRADRSPSVGHTLPGENSIIQSGSSASTTATNRRMEASVEATSSSGPLSAEPHSRAISKQPQKELPTIASSMDEGIPSRSPTVTSVNRSSEGSIEVAVAQRVTVAPSQAVRLSTAKKEADVMEKSGSTATPGHDSPSSHKGSQESPTLDPSPRDADGASNEATEGAAASVDRDPSASTTDKRQSVAIDTDADRSLAVSLASQRRLASASERPSRGAPSAWKACRNVPTAQSVPSTPFGVAFGRSGAHSELGHGRIDMRDGAESVASNHSTLSSLGDRRREILNDKAALLSNLTESKRQEILKRTEGRFAGAFGEVAQAFRQLQADKMMLEQIVREKTPLSGVGNNNENLSAYLTSMNAKLQHSNSEIRKLLDLLEQQRQVIDQMLATHQLEKENYQEDVERLRHALEEAQLESDRNHASIVRLNEELTRAHAATIKASAEAMKARNTLIEEGRKREKVVQLLRQAKERLHEVETENLVSPQLRRSSAGQESAEDIEKLSLDQTQAESSESEVARLRKLLEERDAEIVSLRLGHADAVMHSVHTDDDSVSVADSTTDKGVVEDAAAEIARLRDQLEERKEREKQIRTAYVYVREELRKANHERRRSSVQSLTSPSSPFSHFSPAVGRSRFGLQEHGSSRSPSSNLDDAEGPTPTKLKRLSLPIVAKASGLVGANATGHASPEGREWMGESHPPSSFRGVSGEGSVDRNVIRHQRRHSRQALAVKSASMPQSEA